jgi:hypothetical protein
MAPRPKILENLMVARLWDVPGMAPARHIRAACDVWSDLVDL